MAKRISLAERRAVDSPRGVDVLFNTPSSAGEGPTSQGAALEGNASDESSSPVETKAVSTSSEAHYAPSSSKTSNLTGRTVAAPKVEAAPGNQYKGNPPEKPVLAKATVYIRPDQVLAIESIQLSLRQKTGQKPDKSELFQEAVDLLVAKYGL